MSSRIPPPPCKQLCTRSCSNKHTPSPVFDPALWKTFISTTLVGLEVPTLDTLPRLHSSPLAKCGCKKFCMDFHGDHTSTCTSHWRVPIPNRYTAKAKLCFCKNNKRTIIIIIRCNKDARLDGKRARAVVSYGRTLGQNTARRHGQRRSTAWRCGGEDPPEGSSWESKLKSLTSALPMTGLGQAVTCNRTGPSRIPRTLTARCVLLRSVKPTPIGKHMLTIRTFLFSQLS
jgi:hypothetical protein